METPAQNKPSFSPYRRWKMALQVCLIIAVVLSVVVMVNYLSREHSWRFYLSERTKIQLHSRTLKLLDSITNEVKVTIYYDKKEGFYSTITELLNAYARANPRISVKTVDYQRDPVAGQKIKEQYRLGSATDKNLVIFDCAGRVKPVNGNALADYTLERLPEAKETLVRRKPLAFRGEMMFSSALLWVSSPRPLKAYFLQGHGEHRIESADETGYMKFAAVLRQNCMEVEPLSLLGTNAVPADCNLLIAGGARVPLLPTELERIEKYLNEGGRLLGLFNTPLAVSQESGLEQILAKWGVQVGGVAIRDPDHSSSGSDVIVSAFATHPLVNSVVGFGLYLERPRFVSKGGPRLQSADAPRVDQVAFSSPGAFMEGDPGAKRYQFPLIVAVERGAIKGVSTERAATRMVVAGDSVFLDNAHFDYLKNRDFAVSAVDWLLDRTQLLEGVGPRPLTEYRLVMTQGQLQKAQWILLAGMPGGVLLLGSLVWMRRRR